MRAVSPPSVVVLSLALALTACSSPEPSAAGLEWRACTGVDVSRLPAELAPRIEVTCAGLVVPLEHETGAGADAASGTVSGTASGTPSGTASANATPSAEAASSGGTATITISLVRVHLRPATTATTPTGVTAGASTGDAPTPQRPPLLLIAGGPGQSGVDNAVQLGPSLPTPLLDRFDLVGFDPRGVARSSPIRCNHPDRPTPALLDGSTTAGFDAVVAEIRRSTNECLTALGASAGAFSTTATARDIDLIRAALGQDTLRYVGWSYGAKLGAEYARLHPDRVAAAVLDAPTDPTVPHRVVVDRVIGGFESAFDRFAAWCATDQRCSRIGDARAAASRLVEAAEREPIPSRRRVDTEPSRGTDVLDGIISALYDDVRWSDLGDALAQAAGGDSGTLRALTEAAQGPADGDSNQRDALFVVNCNDRAGEPVEAELRSDAAELVARYPLFGRYGPSFLVQCVAWSPVRHTLVAPVAPTTAPVVVVGTRHDPATPYAGAEGMARSLGNAVLLTWEGDGHTAFGRDPCVGAAVTAYLVGGAVPAAGTTCPA